ncbi:sigma-54 factor interaction domain-containing protein, partial [Pseudomonas sp. BGM005]|nr:sigma-54 factor interaction domain-containing protein [Pseudomonas sp. BG5]
DKKGRDGKFKLADGGTLFLDELGDMPMSVQVKLLRALQEGEIEPLGSNKLVRFDVRVVAATSRDLQQMVRDGTFREDLYYRLNVLPIRVP